MKRMVNRPPSSIMATFQMSFVVKRDMVWMYQGGDNWEWIYISNSSGIIVMEDLSYRRIIWLDTMQRRAPSMHWTQKIATLN